MSEELKFREITQEEDKITILTISDHPMSPSGVGTQTRYIIEGMLKTGKYKFISMGGAINHPEDQPQKTEEWGDDWIIYPVEGYGNQDQVRTLLRQHRPDILYFMTDPRFYGWLWDIENEIRSQVPMVYYHVWDNLPYPDFNTSFYLSNDYIATISKVTDGIVKHLVPDVDSQYLPHAVNHTLFREHTKQELAELEESLKSQLYDKNGNRKLMFFWNNRNARRKMIGSLIYWFKEYLDTVGEDKAFLLLHTDPHDPNGPNLEAILANLNLLNGQIMISKDKYRPDVLAKFYALADCTINIADAEGFGLATLESLSSETPIIVSMTGGLQEQVTDGENWFGIGIEPASKAVVGSQDVPYIYEDRVSKKDFLDALIKFTNMPDEGRKALGKAGREHVIKNYNFTAFIDSWDKVFTSIYKKYGSWEDRKLYKSWELIDLSPKKEAV